MPLLQITDRDAVLRAIARYDELGSEGFLQHYGFGRAKRWYLVHDGKQYDSKAIYGVAVGFQHGSPLTSSDFKGGEGSVVKRLKALRFDVIPIEITDEIAQLPEEVQQSYPEGLRSTVVVNRVERSPAAKAACIAIYGTTCAVCTVDLASVYGGEFEGLIHVHHLRPLSECDESYEVDPRRDLRPVCPNCHAAIHFGGSTRSLEEVRESLSRMRDKG